MQGGGGGVIRLLIAAPSAVVRAGLQSVAAQGANIELAGASSLSGVSAAVERHQPDVLLAAVEAHHDEPPEDLMALAGRVGAPAIVVLAPDLQPFWTADALRAGIRAVLPGDLGAREILAVVAAAAAGFAVLDPQEITALVAERAVPAAQTQALTPREAQVLAMLAEGHGNKIIAWKLGISEHTAKFHVASILSKLNAGTRTEAVTLGIRRGLIMV
jgi:two-component system, NarL family, response regulator YdfI